MTSLNEISATKNENPNKGKWPEIKGDIKKSWNRLTDFELENTKGDMKAVSSLIQQRYGDNQESYSKKLSDIFQKSDEKKSDTQPAGHEKTEKQQNEPFVGVQKSSSKVS